MKKITLSIAVLMLLSLYTQAQSNAKALPSNTYKKMVESITSADITLLQGNGGSIAIDKDNVGLIGDFIEPLPAIKTDNVQTATLLCLIDGREYISGSIYLNTENGYVVFNHEGQEYVNQLNHKGVRFFEQMMEQ